MRLFVLVMLLLIVTGCYRKTPQVAENAVMEVVKSEDKSPVYYGLIVPEEVYLDTVLVEDTTLALTCSVILPIQKDVKWQNANVLLRKQIEKGVKEFIASVRKLLIKYPDNKFSAVSSIYEVTPEQIYVDSMLISYCLEIMYQHAGAVHPMMKYYSFNYDKKKNRQIIFADYFDVKTKQDSLWLIGGISERVLSAEYLDKVYDYDFNVTDSTVSFNFDDYEIASYANGVARATFEKDSVRRYIRPYYN